MSLTGGFELIPLEVRPSNLLTFPPFNLPHDPIYLMHFMDERTILKGTSFADTKFWIPEWVVKLLMTKFLTDLVCSC